MRVLLLSLIAALSVGATQVHAQAASAADSSFDSAGAAGSSFYRERNVSVRERPRPELNALGVHTGGFLMFPKLTLSATTDDNIFATTTGEVSDVIYSVSPSLLFDSQWSQHHLSFFAATDWRTYGNNSGEDSFAYEVSVDGQVDIVRETSLSGSLSTAHRIEPRTSANAILVAAEPAEYDINTASLRFRSERNRFRFIATGSAADTQYDPTALTAGGALDQSFRDVLIARASGEVAYAVSPSTAVFGLVEGNVRDYGSSPVVGPVRDSSGSEIALGLDFELTRLLRGRAQLGYLEQDFDSPLIGDIEGVNFSGNLEWFPTQLITVSLEGGRSVGIAGLSTTSGYDSDRLRLQVDYELLRNFILTLEAEGEAADYRGIDRRDDRTYLALGGTYLFNRRWGLTGRATYQQQDSRGLNAGVSYDDTRFSLILVAQY